ncbi:MAG: Hsp70 family protein [Bacteroidota bacterium]
MNTISMDFGTYNSAVAFRLPGGEAVLLNPARGRSPIIPSFLKFTKEGELESIGEHAKNARASDPAHVLWGVKRLLGCSYRDALERGELSRFEKESVLDAGGRLVLKVGTRLYTPIEIVSLFLRRVREMCEAEAASLPAGGAPEGLVLTHPAYFDAQQIGSLKEAALNAGYRSVELLREPEAAAIAYKGLIEFEREPLVMVIDWGAGTLDFFIAHFFLEEGKPVIAPATPAFGDTYLGGMDMDGALLRRFRDVHRLGDPAWRVESRLLAEIEQAKIALSEREFVQRFFAEEGVQVPLNLVRSEALIPAGQTSARWVCLEETLRDPAYGGILEQFKENLRFTLRKHDLTPGDIESVILVGGPMCMPAVRGSVREVFAENPAVCGQLARLEQGFPISPFEAVAKGAILRGEVNLGAISSAYTYGFLLDGKLLPGLLIPRGTPIARGSDLVMREMPTLSVRAGELVDISLYMKIETAGGVEHWKLGNYQFAPVARAGSGTSVKPSIELNSEEICSLKMYDRVSGNTLVLTFKEDNREKIPGPETHRIPGQEELDGMKKSDPQLYEDFIKAMTGGEFQPADVDRIRNDAATYERVVRQAVNERLQIPSEALARYRRLTELLPRVASGQPIKAASPEAQVLQELLNNLMELISILRNAGFQF